jgi:hypothetical protein
MLDDGVVVLVELFRSGLVPDDVTKKTAHQRLKDIGGKLIAALEAISKREGILNFVLNLQEEDTL